MISLAFNPLTVSLGALCIILMVSMLLPADTWDRVKDWAAYRVSYGMTPDDMVAPELEQRPMPWEKDARDARMAAAAIMQGEHEAAENCYGADFAKRWNEGRQADGTDLRS